MIRIGIALFSAFLLLACGGSPKKTNSGSDSLSTESDPMSGGETDGMDDGEDEDEDEAGEAMPDDFGSDGAVDDM